MRRPGNANATTTTAEEQLARRQAIDAAIARLGELQAERELSDDVVAPLRMHHQDRLRQVDYRRDDEDAHTALSDLHDELELLLVAAERDYINDLFRDGKLKDEPRRRIERELDLREAQINHQRGEK